MAFKNILVPVVGNPADEEALHLAVHTAHQDKAKVLGIHVIEVQRNLPLNSENAAQVEHGGKILAVAEHVVKLARGSIETELLQARAAGPAIIDEAVERKIDLIIVGVPYRKPLGEFILGATTNYILDHAPCRVWLCRELPPDAKK